MQQSSSKAANKTEIVHQVPVQLYLPKEEPLWQIIQVKDQALLNASNVTAAGATVKSRRSWELNTKSVDEEGVSWNLTALGHLVAFSRSADHSQSSLMGNYQQMSFG
jgi:hypothetical protein